MALPAQAEQTRWTYTDAMSRLASLLALLLPVLSHGTNIRVVPSLTAPVCGGACGLGASLGSRLDLTAARPLALTAALAPSLLAAPAPGPAAPAAALSAPAQAAGSPLIVPGRADGAPRKLFVAETGDIEGALAAANAADARDAAPQADVETLARLRARFDGSRPAGADGGYELNALSPALLLQPERLGSLQRAVEDLRREVDAAVPGLRRSVELGRWNGPSTTLDGPCCGDAAPKLAALLRLRGWPAMLVEAEFHFYVVVRLPDGDVVVDPTFRQFFGREKAPSSVPQVFVGTWGELDEVFQRHRAAKSTKHGVARIYRSEARGREDLLAPAADALTAAEPAPEQRALRPALSAAQRRREPPSLIVP